MDATVNRIEGLIEDELTTIEHETPEAEKNLFTIPKSPVANIQMVGRALRRRSTTMETINANLAFAKLNLESVESEMSKSSGPTFTWLNGQRLMLMAKLKPWKH